MVSAYTPPVQALIDELGRLEPDELTPRQALETIYRLKKLADS